MAGVDFVIGGKDNATPAMQRVEKSLSNLEKSVSRLSRVTSTLKTVTLSLAGAYAAIRSVQALVTGANAINNAYDRQIGAVKGLETALRLQGAEVEKESARLQKFAADMQKLTGVGDELTLSMMKQAAMMGVATDDLDDMAKAAIGLAQATGTDAASAMETLRRAQDGNFASLSRLMPEVRQMSSDEERLAAVLELSRKGFEAKIGASNSLAGMTDRARGAIGDLMESVWALIAPVRLLVAQGTRVLAESLQTALVPAVQYAQQVLENMGPIMEWLRVKIITGVNEIIKSFTFYEVVFTNLGTVWEMATTFASLQMERLASIVSHTLTVVIPEYASWFARNFVNLVRDAFNAVITVVQNAGHNLGEMVFAIFDFIRSGMRGGIGGLMDSLAKTATKSLLDGFESSLEALPEIAGRAITARERDLADKLGTMAGNLGDEFNKKLAGRLIDLGSNVGDEISKDIALKMRDRIAEQTGGMAGGQGGALQATEGRLLTRGIGDRRQDWMQKVAESNEKIAALSEEANGKFAAMESELREMRQYQQNAEPVQLVPAG